MTGGVDESLEQRDTAAALLSLAHDLARLGEPKEIASRIAAAIPKVAAVDASAVVFLDREAGVLRVDGLWGWPPELAAAAQGFTLPLDASPLIAEVVANPKPVYVTPEIDDPVVTAVLHEFEADAALVVPIARRGEVIGLVAGVRRGEVGGNVSPELTTRLQGLADIAATALDNALLYSALQDQFAAVAGFEERYRIVSELTSDIAYAYIVRPHGEYDIEWATDGIERISGYTGEEALALGGWPGLVVPDDLPVIRAHTERVEAGDRSTCEFRIRTKSGDERWLEVVDTPMTGDADGSTRVVGAVRDIHDRRAAQQTLVEREALLREAQSLASIGNWRVDAGLNVLDWSEEMARLFGWTEPEPPPPGWVMDHIHPADVGELEAVIRAASQSGDVAEHEYRIIRNDGAIRWMHMRCEMEFDERGAPLVFKGTTQDVTTRRDAEEYRRVIADAVSDAVFSYSVVEDGLILDWVSAAWERLTGFPPDPKPTELFYPIVHHDDRALVEDAQARTLAGEHTVDEFRVTIADGSIRWLRIYAIPVTDSLTGRVARVYGAAQDVTERRVAEDALAQSEAQLRQLIDASPLAVMVFEPSGALSLMNPAAEALFGYTLDEVREIDGPPPWVGPEHAAEFAELAKRVVRGERITGFETQRRRRDGSTVDVSVSLAPLERGPGQPVGGLAVMSDISERTRLEEELRHAQKMHAIGRLAGGVAHDFNNILTAILGHADFLLEEASGNGAVREHADAIRIAGERASALTEQMLLMSRQRAPITEVVNLNDEVAAMHDMLARLVGEQVSLEMRLAPARLPVRFARVHLHQVLLNLVINARDALSPGGTIGLETSSHGDGDLPATAILRVTDTGAGMDADVRERVFEPFFTTKETGVGLGLSVVYGIVQGAGGDITVSSTPGHGTTFEVEIPLHHRGGERAEPGPGSAPATVSILLVEDEPDVRAVAASALRRRGYAVVTAADADDALAAARSLAQPADLLVTDLVMPGIGGGELSERLRADWPGVRVLYMSGYSEVIPDEVSEAGGHCRFLQKPFAPEALLALVDELLREGAQPRA